MNYFVDLSLEWLRCHSNKRVFYNSEFALYSTLDILLVYLIDCGIALKKVPLTPGSET